MNDFNRKFIYFICLASAMGGLLFGYNWVVIGGAKPFYEVYFRISHDPTMQGLAMSIALTGCLLGAECLHFPDNLGEGMLHGAQLNDFYYLMGNAYFAKGDKKKAAECWTKATEGPTEPAPALYYNDAKPDKIFYAGLAFRALGEEAKARGCFNRLAEYGRQHFHDEARLDYFAVSLPDLLIWDESLETRNKVHCLYMLALGSFGLHDMSRYRRYIDEAAALDPNHQGIIMAKRIIDSVFH